MHLNLIIKFPRLSITLESDAIKYEINTMNIVLKRFQTNMHFMRWQVNRRFRSTAGN